jgi:hypothetical protein
MELPVREPQGRSVRDQERLTHTGVDAWQAQMSLIMRHGALKIGDTCKYLSP